ncbi:MAG: M20/M25/M40 family metallo-hydrolase [Clostridia bacterium]|nr:M20/M25/M40 family metallo-hydrolase [Clostridia bacterium]
MANELTQEILDYLSASVEDATALLKELCAIPAPSHFEDERAAYVKKWFDSIGAKGAYIDEAKNVIFPLNCEGRSDIIVFEAHTDTVFPAETPLVWREDEKNYYCPGIGDDTVNLVNMLMTVRYIVQKGLTPTRGVLFVANSCEEGLGNLKGTRQIFKDYEGRIERFVTFDGGYRSVVARAVGSHRYKIDVKTQGGHSWNNFGRTNAIVELSRLITSLCDVTLPQVGSSKTTYNVGTIDGGTSVNTVAQNASCLYEYRSDNAECLAIMEKTFREKLEAFRAATDAEITVETVGLRPCGEAKDKALHQEMIDRALEVSRQHSGLKCGVTAGSTDCNIPLSLGIPAICPGLYLGGGAHTREEWCEIASIPVGMKVAASLILDYFAL